jgi:diguanylate cyclase (GGDEF)-like protein
LIKIPKRPSFNFLFSRSFLSKHPPFKIFLYIIVFSFLFVILPIYCVSKFTAKIKFLSAFYIFNIFAVYYLATKFYKTKARVELNMEELGEKMNTICDQIEKEKRLCSSLGFKISRYNSLKNIIQQLNNTFDLEAITGQLADIAFSQIARSQGTCLLYLVDAPNQRLNLYTSRKDEAHLVIKAKQGDIFDSWVLKHTTALFIEDIKKDFRFDIERIDKEHKRDFSSLISSPLVSEKKVLGIIRLDSRLAHFFTQDDLRLLNTISDLGAVSLENFELFEKTQELAIKDGLTALYRKGYFLERLNEEFIRTARQKEELSLLMADIDHFKDYNDKFGHIAGDIVLKEVARSMVDSFDTAILCRFGGEEFCVLLSKTNKKSALILAERFRKEVQDKKIILRRQKTGITVSIGVASYPADATTQEELLHRADSALYQAKGKGRNRVCSA